jgi:hypothetical protein
MGEIPVFETGENKRRDNVDCFSDICQTDAHRLPHRLLIWHRSMPREPRDLTVLWPG